MFTMLFIENNWTDFPWSIPKTGKSYRPTATPRPPFYLTPWGTIGTKMSVESPCLVSALLPQARTDVLHMQGKAEEKLGMAIWNQTIRLCYRQPWAVWVLLHQNETLAMHQATMIEVGTGSPGGPGRSSPLLKQKGLGSL